MPKVSIEHSAEMAALRKCGTTLPDIVKMFPMYGRATVYRHAKKEPGQGPRVDGRKNNKGRPRKLDERDKRSILRAIPRLRAREGQFHSKRVAVVAGVEHKAHNRTVRRVLNQSGYGFFVARKKGPKESRALWKLLCEAGPVKLISSRLQAFLLLCLATL